MTSQEYNAIVKEYNVRIFRFLVKNLGETELSKDLLQETFMKLWEHKDRIKIESVKSWLFTTAYHAILKQISTRNKTTIRDVTEMELQEKANDSFENKQLFEHYLPLLPTIQRSILVLKDLEGYNYKEIGELLSISDSQVKVYLFRARQKLKDLLEAQEIHI